MIVGNISPMVANYLFNNSYSKFMLIGMIGATLSATNFGIPIL